MSAKRPTRRYYEIEMSPIGYFEIGPAGYLDGSPTMPRYEGYVAVATGTLQECRAGAKKLEQVRRSKFRKLSLEEISAVLTSS